MASKTIAANQRDNADIELLQAQAPGKKVEYAAIERLSDAADIRKFRENLIEHISTNNGSKMLYQDAKTEVDKRIMDALGVTGYTAPNKARKWCSALEIKPETVSVHLRTN